MLSGWDEVAGLAEFVTLAEIFFLGEGLYVVDWLESVSEIHGVPIEEDLRVFIKNAKHLNHLINLNIFLMRLAIKRSAIRRS